MPQVRPPMRTSQPLLPRWMVVAAPVLALGALLVTVVLAVTGDDDEPEAGATARYAAAVNGVFEDAGADLLQMVDVGNRWLGGEATDDELAAALDDAEAALPDVRDGLQALEEPPGVAPAARFYLACADLYGRVVDAHRAALEVDGAEREERNLLARRIRTLADRTYDRAKQLVDPDAEDPEGITLVRSKPVPVWEEEGLAPTAAVGAAGQSFEAQAAERAIGGTERAYRGALQLLVLAEADRSRVLGLDDLAAGLEQVAGSMGG